MFNCESATSEPNGSSHLPRSSVSLSTGFQVTYACLTNWSPYAASGPALYIAAPGPIRRPMVPPIGSAAYAALRPIQFRAKPWALSNARKLLPPPPGTEPVGGAACGFGELSQLALA